MIIRQKSNYLSVRTTLFEYSEKINIENYFNLFKICKINFSILFDFKKKNEFQQQINFRILS